MIKLRNYIAMLFLLIMPVIASASVPPWQIVDNESSLIFTGTQNGAPVSGQFKHFSGEINFDPAQLSASNVRIIVDIASISTALKDIQTMLKTADWFDAKLFPQAIFKADKFTKLGGNSYQANGTLTIRDKTIPVTINFAVEELSRTKVKVTGSTNIKRSVFNVGQGDWADTSEIKDDVKVSFIITAIKK